MAMILDAWRRHPLMTAAFALASVVTLVFLVRFVAALVYWSAHENEPVRPWMTVGYVGRSWGVAPRELDAEAGLSPPMGKPRTLAEIAAERNVPVATVIAEVEAAIERIRARDEAEAEAP